MLISHSNYKTEMPDGSTTKYTRAGDGRSAMMRRWTDDILVWCNRHKMHSNDLQRQINGENSWLAPMVLVDRGIKDRKKSQ